MTMWKPIVSILLLVLVIAFAIAAGISGYLLYGGAKIEGEVKPLVIKILQEYVADDASIHFVVEKILQLGKPIFQYLFIGSCILLVFVSMGFIGVCCDYPSLRKGFSLIVILIVIGLIISIVIFVIKDDQVEKTINEFGTDMLEGYVSMVSRKPKSLGAGVIMVWWQCCGRENGSEYANSSAFSKTDTFSGKDYGNLDYPIPCCKKHASEEPTACPNVFTTDNSFIEVGCTEKIKHSVMLLLNSYMIWASVTVVVLGLLAVTNLLI